MKLLAGKKRAVMALVGSFITGVVRRCVVTGSSALLPWKKGGEFKPLRTLFLKVMSMWKVSFKFDCLETF